MTNIKYDKFLVLGFLWIFLTSMLDHYFTIKFQDTIVTDEMNPFGRFLLRLDGGSVALFMTLKWSFSGLLPSLSSFSYRVKKKFAYACTLALSMVQLCLIFIFYLCLNKKSPLWLTPLKGPNLEGLDWTNGGLADW